MKKMILFVLISFFVTKGFAQEESEEEVKKGFKKENLFTGGGLNLSLSTYNFGLGASPVLGYSFNKWFEAGFGLSYIYVAEREAYDNGYEIYETGNKIHQSVIAPMMFARLFPFKFGFLQAQLEENFVSQKLIYGNYSEKVKFDATSLLLGMGYAGGREGVGNFFYYFSVSIDVLKNRNSPYVMIVNDQYGEKVLMIPIIKAGIQIPLFQGKDKY